MAMTFAIIYGSKTEFADEWHSDPKKERNVAWGRSREKYNESNKKIRLCVSLMGVER